LETVCCVLDEFLNIFNIISHCHLNCFHDICKKYNFYKNRTMKRVILLTLCLCAALGISAQIKVGDEGKVMVGSTSGTPKSILSVGNAGDSCAMFSISNNITNAGRDCLRIYNRGDYASTSQVVGMTLYNDIRKYGGNTGIYVYPSINFSYDECIGVKSIAGNSEKGNYGVFGGLVSGCTDGSSPTKGAGIYGSCSTNMAFSYTGHYAGYFYGDVRLDRGVLYGSVVTSASSSSANSISGDVTVLSASIDDESEESVSSRLQDVQLLQIYNTPSSAENEILAFDSDSSMTSAEKIAVSDKAIEKFSSASVSNAVEPEIRYSLDADQLRKVFPELVYEDNDGNLGINYVEMVPLLLQYANELKSELNELKSKMAEITGESMNVNAYSKSLASSIEGTDADVVSLSQNDPNPFTESTKISLNVPSTVKSAYIFIYDMSGKEVTRMEITERGSTSLSVSGTDLTSGMYLYSLLTDGKVIATKRMMLTK